MGTDLTDVDKEADRVAKDIKGVVSCGDTGAYASILGCNVPVKGHTKQPVMERFLTDDRSVLYPAKKEVLNMFPIEMGVFEGNGAVNTDFIKKRSVTSSRVNDGIETGERIGPGLGRGPYDDSQRGIHPLFRVLPKDVNELRTYLHEKDTYEPQQLVGQFATKNVTAGHIGQIEKRTSETFTSRADLTTRSRAKDTAEIVVGKFRDDPTQRDLRSVPIVGGRKAYDKFSQHVLDYYVEEPDKNEYRTPDPLIVSNSTQGHSTLQASSILIPFTQRAAGNTCNKNQGPATSITHGRTAVNYFDIPKDTARQSTNMKQPAMNVSSVIKGTPQYSVPGMTPGITERDLSLVNTRGNNIRGAQKGINAPRAEDFTDIPDMTVRQTTAAEPFHSTYQQTGQGYVRATNFSDIPDVTIRDTTAELTNLAPASAHPKQQINEVSLPREIGARQLVYQNVHSGQGASSQVAEGPTYDPNDIMKFTGRQTLSVPVPTTNTRKAVGGGFTNSDIEESRNLPSRETIPHQTLRQSGVSSATKGDRIITQGDVPEMTQRDATQSIIDRPQGPALQVSAQGSGYRATGVQQSDTQRQVNPYSTPSAGARGIVSGGIVVDKQTIQLDEARNQEFEVMSQRGPTKVGNASFPNKSTAVGNSLYLKPDNVIIDHRGLTPFHASTYDNLSFTNEVTHDRQRTDISRIWSRVDTESQNETTFNHEIGYIIPNLSK